MNALPNFNRFPGPGDLPGDSSHPNSPDYVQASSVLDCPNETGTWLAENLADTIQTTVIELIGDFLAGPQDVYAVRKMQREFAELAYRCEDAIHAHEEKKRRAA